MKRKVVAITVLVLLGGIGAALGQRVPSGPGSSIAQIVSPFPVDLGKVKLVRGIGPSSSSWIATMPTPAGSAGGMDIGWFAFDQSFPYSASQKFTLHYGAFNSKTVSGTNPQSNVGTVWSPVYKIAPTKPCEVWFEYSYNVGSTGPNNDRMEFAYRVGGAFISVPIVKPTTTVAWTTLKRSIQCMGATTIQFRWTFDSGAPVPNEGQTRGWNLQRLTISQN